VIVRDVRPGSIAGEAGLKAGDIVLEINGFRMFDALDYRFYGGDDFITFLVRRGGETLLFEIEKEPGEDAGLVFDEVKLGKCGNDCVFCFVDQNPPGLREPLYFRDGDYRFSFMYGNFVTLTNVGPKALERIIRLRMSPMYVSVHATDVPTRMRLMGLRKDDRLLDKLQKLHDGGIDMHTQVVLCPGWNDGAVLEKTVDDLWLLRDHVVSLAVVPVGVTRHRRGLPRLEPVTPAYARALIDRVEWWQETRFRPGKGTNWMYPSDEFYLLAGRELPGAEFYDDFPQVENGVGLSRQFLDAFMEEERDFPDGLRAPRRLILATGALAFPFMKEVVAHRLSAIRNLEVTLVPVENTLFGKTVTVSGLLSGACFAEGLRSHAAGDLLLLPPDCVNTDGVFLDDRDPDWLSRKLGVRAMVFRGSWTEALERLGA